MGPEQTTTLAAVLELKAEREVVGEAYTFLDEKRLLLAAELLQQLHRYERLLTQLEATTRAAGQQLGAAVKRHGLQGLGIYPAAALDGAHIETTRRNLMGVMLVETVLQTGESVAHPTMPPSKPSGEAQRCREAFQELIHLGAVLAGISGNLYRLSAEYRITERRARALENVILPDIESALGRMSTYLEEIELEDAIRARPLASKRVGLI
jgi:V/A-type H+-transporting ATPase subunit D